MPSSKSLSKSSYRRYLYISHGISKIKTFSYFFKNHSLRYIPIPSLVKYFEFFNRSASEGMLAWGMKEKSLEAQIIARNSKLPLIRIEDGFLRSVHPGDNSPYSIVIDDLGIYYDASRLSRLDHHIVEVLSNDELIRVKQIKDLWISHEASKYNHAPDFKLRSYLVDPRSLDSRLLDSRSVDLQSSSATNALTPSLNETSDPYVLVIDQTVGDASIKYGLADESSFQLMLSKALADHPDKKVLVKTHPEVVSGKKKGHFDLIELAKHPQIEVISEDCHIPSLLKHASAVYTVTSQVGFEALIWGKPVHTFGMPFYAGWGLTNDHLPRPSHRSSLMRSAGVESINLEQLIHAALVRYPRYLNPQTNESCEVEDLIEYLGLKRKQRFFLAHSTMTIGFSFYKKNVLRRFAPNIQLIPSIKNLKNTAEKSVQLIWGHSDLLCSRGSTENNHITESIIRAEDGFIRSVGLGAELIQPQSWVFDRTGIYYDASQPSDLELLLQSGHFDQALLGRADLLRQKIITSGISKYNLSNKNIDVDSLLNKLQLIDKRIILVPGQVESDASISYGCVDIKTNLALLKKVRSDCPDAYVIYKPHPDVVAKLRGSKNSLEEYSDHCDEVITNIDINQLLTLVNEVHTMTSLTGFEALLRNKKVVCYGQPFYSGWGLTSDLHPHPRRTRKVSLDELVAASLILYPTYLSSKDWSFSTPEKIIDEILTKREFLDHKTHYLSFSRFKQSVIRLGISRYNSYRKR